jgi:hypothetical protein
VKLDESGRPIFVDLMRRRGPFQFVAFDVLALNGKDVRQLDSRIARAAPDHRAEAFEVDPLRAARRRSRPGFLRGSLQPGPRGDHREAEAPTTFRRRWRSGRRSRTRITARRAIVTSFSNEREPATTVTKAALSPHVTAGERLGWRRTLT